MYNKFNLLVNYVNEINETKFNVYHRQEEKEAKVWQRNTTLQSVIFMKQKLKIQQMLEIWKISRKKLIICGFSEFNFKKHINF